MYPVEYYPDIIFCLCVFSHKTTCLQFSADGHLDLSGSGTIRRLFPGLEQSNRFIFVFFRSRRVYYSIRLQEQQTSCRPGAAFTGRISWDRHTLWKASNGYYRKWGSSKCLCSSLHGARPGHGQLRHEWGTFSSTLFLEINWPLTHWPIDLLTFSHLNLILLDTQLFCFQCQCQWKCLNIIDFPGGKLVFSFLCFAAVDFFRVTPGAIHSRLHGPVAFQHTPGDTA